MNLIHEEQILIKDIFNVKVYADQTGSEATHLLHDFPKEISKLGNNISLTDHTTYFDSLIMERLQFPATDILSYLEDCLARCNYAIEKPWNQANLSQKFIKYSVEIIKNFLYLSVTEPEIFPQQIEIDSGAASQINNSKLFVKQEMLSICMKLMTHFQRKGFNLEILQVFYPKITTQVQGDFIETFLEVLVARQRFQTILQSKAFFYISLAESLCSITEFRLKFVKLTKLPFLPTTIKNLTGAMLDLQSPFGLFARTSLLGNSSGYYQQQMEVVRKFEERLILEFGKSKFGKQKLKSYSNLQIELYGKLTDLFKVFLKKQTQKQFLEWLHASVISNLKKSKLGSRLQGAMNTNESHDGLIINLYACLLNLCKVILIKEEGKYKNINPQYFMFSPYYNMCKFEKLRKKDMKSAEKMDVEKQFGTITEFFFLSFQMIHVGLIPAQDSFMEFMEFKERLEKEKMRNPQMAQKIDYEIQKIQSKIVRYFVVLLDDAIILPTIKLFNMFLFLLPQWLNFSYEDLIKGTLKGHSIPQLINYLPQHIFDSIYKFHLTNFKYKQGYLQTIGEQHIHQIVNVTCLLLSQAQIVSNPYIGANFVELLFYMLHQTKSGILFQTFKDNVVAHRNLSIQLVRFYCDIAVTGSSHQFYSKFKYRLFVNKIFTNLWVHQVFREDLKKIFKSDIYQRFINNIMTDTTYCFDQTNEKYGDYKKLQNKRQSGGILTAQQEKTEEQIHNQMSATLQQSTSNLRLMRQLSNWSPETFLSETSLSSVAPLLNNILHAFVEPTSFVANRQLTHKYKFEREIILSDLLQIYVNLDIDESLSSQIVKDKRFYQKDEFNKGLQKASNEHYTDIATLERFEQLIRKLARTVNEEEDEEIFGQIPQKYQCSLMATLMKEPVLLPTSGRIVDRVYIHKHLLNDERDPFTRAALKYNDVIQRKDLKNQIEQWKRKRLQELKGASKEAKYGKKSLNKKQEEQNIFNDKRLGYDMQQQ